jgi:hypothetical protein
LLSLFLLTVPPLLLLFPSLQQQVLVGSLGNPQQQVLVGSLGNLVWEDH